MKWKNKISKRQLEEMLLLKEEGLSIQAIAKITKRTASQVKRQLYKNKSRI